MIAKIEFEVEIPEGWEISDIKEDMSQRILSWNPETRSGFGVFRVRTKLKLPWDTPGFLKKGHWIAMDADGRWFVYENKPEVQFGCWTVKSGSYRRIDGIFNFTPPPCEEWQESLRQI